MSLKQRRSQAALEFLTTYAWAFLVILITIGALYYFGIFDFSKYLPQKCLFNSQFECVDFSFRGDTIAFMLINNIGEEIAIVDIDVTNDATDPLSCTFSEEVPFLWDSGLRKEFLFTDCKDGAFIIGERTDAKVIISYYAVDTPSKPIHQIIGQISANVIKP